MEPLKVKRITFESYILDFSVLDAVTIEVSLCPHRDLTLVDTRLVVIASQEITREAKINEKTGDIVNLEEMSDFCERAYTEAKEWATEEIYRNKEALSLRNTLHQILPVAVEA